MILSALYIRRFRSLGKVDLESFSKLNVLIGRNNSGKSTVLNAIEVAVTQMKLGKIASRWVSKSKSEDDFTDRDVSKPIQIGLTFEISQSVNDVIREFITVESPGMELAVNQLRSESQLSVIYSIASDENGALIYIQDIALGAISENNNVIETTANRILSVNAEAARELGSADAKVTRLRKDATGIEQFDRAMIEYAFREGASRGRRVREMGVREEISRSTLSQIDSIISDSETSEKFLSALDQLRLSIEADIEEIKSSDITELFSIYSGMSRRVPDYVYNILAVVSAGTIANFKETRPAVGREEANQLLKLKTRLMTH